MSESEEEEESKAQAKGRPNTYWQHVRETETVEGLGGAFRGTPTVHHGGKTVTAKQTLGAEDHCYCGEPLDHDWPGKAGGAKHPREKRNVSAMKEELPPRIERQQMRKYPQELQDLIILAVNQYGVKYRVNSSSILLYAPDGSRPFSIGARSGDSYVRTASKWLAEHVIGLREDGTNTTVIANNDALVEDAERRMAAVQAEEEAERVAKVALEALAAALNDPAEHPEPAKVKEEVSTGENLKVAWVPYIKRDGKEAEGYETDGTTIRCTRDNWTTITPKAIGGHEQTVHNAEETRERLWGNSEVQERKEDNRRYNRLHHKVTEAIDLLADLVDYKGDSSAVEDLQAQNAELREEVKRLRAACGDAAQFKARMEEAEAKLALIKELGL